MTDSEAKTNLSSKDFLQLLAVLGPFFLFLTLSLSQLKPPFNYDFWFFIPLSFLFIFRYNDKGFILSTSLLLVTSLIKHFFIPFQFWQLGLEVTLLVGLFITYYSMKETSSLLGFFESEIEDQKKVFVSLEDKLKETETLFQTEKETLQISLKKLQDEWDLLNQKNISLNGLIETLHSELNITTEEKNTLFNEFLQKNKAFKHLKFRYDDLQIEQAKLQDAVNLKNRNQELLKQLNTARVEKYQTHLINEMLARLLSKEARRVKEDLDSCHIKEMEQGALQQNLLNTEKEVKALCLHFEEASNELNKLRQQLEEKNRLIQELQVNDKRAEQLAQIDKLQKESEILKKKLEEKNLLLKNYALSIEQKHHVEAAYLQLRKQFEEKSHLLHQTRGELFQLQTHHEALLREKEFEEKEDQSLSHLLEMEEELQKLEQERGELLSLVTELIKPPPKPVRKKLSSMENQLPIF